MMSYVRDGGHDAEKCCHLVRAHAWCICSRVRQFLIYILFVLVTCYLNCDIYIFGYLFGRAELSSHGGIVEIRSAAVCSSTADHPLPRSELWSKYQYSGIILCHVLIYFFFYILYVHLPHIL